MTDELLKQILTQTKKEATFSKVIAFIMLGVLLILLVATLIVVPRTLSMIAEIERSSGLTATGIINNTNLGVETNAGILRDSFAYAAEVCECAHLPLIATTAFSETASLLTEEERARARIRTIRDATKKIF